MNIQLNQMIVSRILLLFYTIALLISFSFSEVEYETHKMSLNFFNNKTSVSESSNSNNNAPTDSSLNSQEVEYAQLTTQNSNQSPLGGLITANTASSVGLLVGIIIIGLIIYVATHKFK
ncbi:MAG: hypothetical protein ACLFPL_03665 [Candidatus Nanoarchaeia archaeon]